jgi:hypothetical protein
VSGYFVVLQVFYRIAGGDSSIVEVISDPQKTGAIREALDRCSYGPVANLVTKLCSP